MFHLTLYETEKPNPTKTFTHVPHGKPHDFCFGALYIPMVVSQKHLVDSSSSRHSSVPYIISFYESDTLIQIYSTHEM